MIPISPVPFSIVSSAFGSMELRTHVIDATRMSDGKLVYLKKVGTESQELQILSYLTSEEMRRDPRNHCVPLLDVFPDAFEPDKAIIVMPFLRYINSPPFERIEDVLECLDQILEVRPSISMMSRV